MDADTKYAGAIGAPRRRFLDYVNDPFGSRPVVSPFCPHPTVVEGALKLLDLPVGDDPFVNEFRLANELDYEPMVFARCSSLIFPWVEDPDRSDEDTIVSVLPTSKGEWIMQAPREGGGWGASDSQFPVKGVADFGMFIQVCEEVAEKHDDIMRSFRELRARVGDNAVILINHPHISWLGLQAGQQELFYLYHDFPDEFRRAMDAHAAAVEYVFSIALEEGIDFMSESSYGLEMISPAHAEEVDLPYLKRLSDWTRSRGRLFWYHNCGATSKLIENGFVNRFMPHVCETVAPPPEGDNDLGESRKHLDRSICSKGNLSLVLLRDGTEDEVRDATRRMVESVRGYAHIHSTADTVLPGTPPENLIAFIQTAREESER